MSAAPVARDPVDIDGVAVVVAGARGLVRVGAITLTAREAHRLAARVATECGTAEEQAAGEAS